jgi:hypothetical protein
LAASAPAGGQIHVVGIALVAKVLYRLPTPQQSDDKKMKRLRLAQCAGLLLLACATPLQAAPQHPWVTQSPMLDKYAWFSNLQSGAEVTSPFVVRFGLTGIGIAAAKHPVTGAGHHHLLIDRNLPLDFTEPLPFNDQYIHFGKGQMEAVLDLPEGEHTLRLVFADHKHIPNFVYSDALRIKVVGRSAQNTEALARREVSVLAPTPGQRVQAPFAVVLHASGYNISHTEITEPDTGHFRVRMTPANGEAILVELTEGQTELWLQPPPGDYSLRTELVSNTAPNTVLAASTPVAFKVEPR